MSCSLLSNTTRNLGKVEFQNAEFCSSLKVCREWNEKCLHIVCCAHVTHKSKLYCNCISVCNISVIGQQMKRSRLVCHNQIQRSNSTGRPWQHFGRLARDHCECRSRHFFHLLLWRLVPSWQQHLRNSG